MLTFILRRLIYMVPTIVVISIVAFLIIQLPPGDYLTSYIAKLAQTGTDLDQSAVASLRARYGLDQPLIVQYLKWVGGMLEGNFGYSFEWNRPVSRLIIERLPLTLIVSTCSLLVAWAIALPIGIYSAVKQYSIADYVFTFIGFVGLGVPSFMIALIFLYLSNRWLGLSVGGLFSPEYVNADWSLAKFADLLSHLWIPVVIVAVGGTASLIRITRANVLDELRKPYVETARAKGLPKWRLILKYPVRIALNPFISSVGFILPAMISGEVIVSIVLNLPTAGPLLYGALVAQDMYLAGSFVMALAFLTVLGVLLSDILLAWLDPRVRYE
jgi:peptide/nickel transport system permease protein